MISTVMHRELLLMDYLRRALYKDLSVFLQNFGKHDWRFDAQIAFFSPVFLLLKLFFSPINSMLSFIIFLGRGIGFI